MSSTPADLNPSSNHINGEQNYGFALVSLTSLFFMWGFITCLNDILIPYLKNMFDLNFTQAMLIQFCFFSAYFLVSLPAGKLVAKLGYQKGIVVGLLVACVGCVMFYPAAALKTYPLFLGALFVLASGITILQVSANPYVSVLGRPETSSSRLTMTQAFNSLGTTVAPYFGGVLILGAAVNEGAAMGESVKVPYLLLALMLLILALVFTFLKLPTIQSAEQQTTSSTIEDYKSALSHRHLSLGALGIFVYVGAEVSIGSFMINYFGLERVMSFEESEAAKYITYYWGGAMVGRFFGAVIMQKVDAGKVLAFNALAAVVLLLTTMLSNGAVAMWALLLVGLCNSIMFPTIFSLALKNLKEVTSHGSGVLCLAIVGGAVLPLLQGLIADGIGLTVSFVMPIVCYLYIAFYGVNGSKVSLENQPSAVKG
ncbi:sugar MFS transporter [Psychrosphaera ytuae]|uniref:Sugar MFS transporter n=1 Tax=Psychrosphaera ytuae TaxID=2820710 RepID=A0A975HH34_9GAMM|nr:sugar MFS transporter [Psychrosphaera ytuae]QTH62761.1 sugar MFS transporter [Psychrosphaera ytuae]